MSIRCAYSAGVFAPRGYKYQLDNSVLTRSLVYLVDSGDTSDEDVPDNPGRIQIGRETTARGRLPPPLLES
jgi:hypothetical protein